ncbi:hypothetical protein AXF42_Ash010764 [Apostasia shenzhenica]|uniref:Polymerase/histidinol phosphatase N-terminal domain-containing protein n=1 Tax=Apostasia shenzhenica TaxID=1088818 RepID=A0A2I0A0K1_9ASPA|nr:hypothetical protein AXF42_Ash010764 [Apostasia shenzhenica]
MGGGKKKGKGKRKKKPPPEHLLSHKYIKEWVFGDSLDAAAAADDFEPTLPGRSCLTDRVVFEFHCHSKCSDGFLSPYAVVEKAHRNGVKVLSLTDHDTMAGIPEAMEAARKFGMLIVPGVEISSICFPGAENEEPVHILAYYGSCGPSAHEELNELLTHIRDGRFIRAKKMLLKLNNLKIPLKWEQVFKVAGEGVAPGRLHVAKAMVQAGYVESLKQAFSKYLYDGGPAYAMGNEPSAAAAVQLICKTGGVAALAHPWALKNPAAVIRSLKSAGLHAMEVYRADGKVVGFGEFADSHDLIKLGGSDFHGRGGNDESELGSVDLPLISICKFLKLARPIWCDTARSILQRFSEEPSSANLEKITMFGKPVNLRKCASIKRGKDIIDLCLSSWLTIEERQAVQFEEIRRKLSDVGVSLT